MSHNDNGPVLTADNATAGLTQNDAHPAAAANEMNTEALQAGKENNKPAAQRQKKQADKKRKQQQETDLATASVQDPQANGAAKEGAANQAKAYGEDAESWADQMVDDTTAQHQAGQVEASGPRGKNNKKKNNQRKKQTRGGGQDEIAHEEQDEATMETAADDAKASAENAGGGSLVTSAERDQQRGAQYDQLAPTQNKKRNNQRQNKKHNNNAKDNVANGETIEQSQPNEQVPNDFPTDTATTTANGGTNEKRDSHTAKARAPKESEATPKEPDFGGLSIIDLRTLIIANGSILFNVAGNPEIVLASKSSGSNDGEKQHYAVLVQRPSIENKVKAFVAGKPGPNVRQALRALLGETQKSIHELLLESAPVV